VAAYPYPTFHLSYLSHLPNAAPPQRRKPTFQFLPLLEIAPLPQRALVPTTILPIPTATTTSLNQITLGPPLSPFATLSQSAVPLENVDLVTAAAACANLDNQQVRQLLTSVFHNVVEHTQVLMQARAAAETIVVGATPEGPAIGKYVDIVKAAWHAAEVAMRL
jgi:hypothetical protein